MKRKIKDVIFGVFFLLFTACGCIAGISGLVRAIPWVLMPITAPTCDGRVMAQGDTCELTSNGLDVGSKNYDEQLASQQFTQLCWRIMSGIVVVVIVGAPLLVFVSGRKKKRIQRLPKEHS